MITLTSGRKFTVNDTPAFADDARRFARLTHS
ncbi:hypothetical protein JOE60_000015 [Paenarthrobacter ilicis]|uniref:Uncharacterized protein n=1 Tax=Paenarthrobacter ilicis TaxID=43665 RepID=A0ABX0TJF4_9MICC|nr:hypothetical protein [Paenarthrobacter ilicis]NIJ02692.1 hypothetical protein [Paenarthrobacter ilicis]